MVDSPDYGSRTCSEQVDVRVAVVPDPHAIHHVGEGELGELGQHQSTTGQPVSSTSVAATRSPSPAWLTLFGSGPGEWSTASFFVGHPRGSRN